MLAALCANNGPGSAADCRSVAIQLHQQPLGIERAFGGRQFKPVTRTLRLVDRRLGTKTTVFELGATIPGTRGLAQQLMTDASIPSVSAIATQHLPQATLRHHHPAPRRLLEQTTGEVLDAGFLIQARVVQ